MKTKAWMIMAVVCSLSLATACGEDEEAAGGDDTQAATDETGGEDTTAEEPEEPEEPEAPPGPVAEDPTYELRATAAGPYTAGSEASFQIQLTPRGEYHVNQDFPMEIALSGPDGVTLPGDTLGNGDAAEFTEETARFDVPFTAAAAGEHTVTAEVDFAVCTPQACFPEHRTLALAVAVN